jgi:hypothetical protein
MYSSQEKYWDTVHGYISLSQYMHWQERAPELTTAPTNFEAPGPVAEWRPGTTQGDDTIHLIAIDAARRTGEIHTFVCNLYGCGCFQTRL